MVEFTRWGKVTPQQQRTTVARVDNALVMVHTDGSYLPLENKMGAGGVVHAKDGRWTSGFAASLGAGDAFKAELLAIQKGLNHVWEMGYISVVCYTDCTQATEVLGTNIDITNYWHREEFETIRGLLQRNWRVIISHVDREDNQVADALAKVAAHEKWAWKLWSQPPIARIA